MRQGGSDCFIGHGVMFTNDLYPRATAGSRLQTEADWTVVRTTVKAGATLGSGSCGHHRRRSDGRKP